MNPTIKKMSHTFDLESDDPYEILGIEKDCDKKDLKRAYLIASKRYHPDASGTADEFQKIKWAYDLLIDNVRREKFDTTGDSTNKKATLQIHQIH